MKIKNVFSYQMNFSNAITFVRNRVTRRKQVDIAVGTTNCKLTVYNPMRENWVAFAESIALISMGSDTSSNSDLLMENSNVWNSLKIKINFIHILKIIR